MALADNILSYWKLDESSGNASDSVGSNTGTNSSVTYSSGKINNCAVFNGSAKFTIANESNFDFLKTSAFSVSFWVKTSGAGEMQLISKLGSSSPYSGWEISIGAVGTAGAIAFVLSNSYGSNYILKQTSSTVNDNVFHHIVVTFSGNSAYSGVKIYIDGSESSYNANVGDSLTNASTNNLSLIFGARQSSNYLTGYLDEIGIWTKELSSSEVTQLYNSGNGFQYPFTSTAARVHNLGTLGVGA